MLVIEIIAAISTLLCVILLRRKSFWGWPVGIIGAVCYGIMFYDLEFYGQFSIQIVFVIQSALGWYYWKKSDSTVKKIQKYNPQFILDVMTIMFIFYVVAWVGSPSMHHMADTVKEDIIHVLDWYGTTLALFATFLLIGKAKASWVIWAITDVVLITLFALQELWWSMGLYIILFGIAVKTAYDWHKEWKRYDNTLKIVR